MNKQVRHYDKDFKGQAMRWYLSRNTSLPKLGEVENLYLTLIIV